MDPSRNRVIGRIGDVPLHIGIRRIPCGETALPAFLRHQGRNRLNQTKPRDSAASSASSLARP